LREKVTLKRINKRIALAKQGVAEGKQGFSDTGETRKGTRDCSEGGEDRRRKKGDLRAETASRFPIRERSFRKEISPCSILEEEGGGGGHLEKG